MKFVKVAALASLLVLGAQASRIHAGTTSTTITTATAPTADPFVPGDNKFVDGNWFSIAESRGESYAVGSPTNLQLEAQIKAYQTARDSRDLMGEEHYAIRSWVKGCIAAEIGLEALEKGDTVTARIYFHKAIKDGLKAQAEGAGKGEAAPCGGDAAHFRSCSTDEGKWVVAYAEKYLDKIGYANAGSN